MMFPADRISDLQKDVQLKKAALSQSRHGFSEILKSTFKPSNIFKRYALPILSTIMAAAASLPFLIRSKKSAAKQGAASGETTSREYVPGEMGQADKGRGWLSKLFMAAGMAAAQSLAPLAVKGAHQAVSKFVKHVKSRKHKRKSR